MKFFLFIYLCFILPITLKAQKYLITGRVVNLPYPSPPAINEGDTILLEVKNINKKDIVIVHNNIFQFSGTSLEPTTAFLTYKHGGLKILLDNSSYVVSLKQVIQSKKNGITYYDMEQSITTNSKFHNLWSNFMKKMNGFYARKNEILTKIDDIRKTDSTAIYKQQIKYIDNIMNFSYKKLAMENTDNYAVPYILTNAGDFSYSNYIGIYNILSDKVKQSYLGNNLLEKLNAVKSLDETSSFHTAERNLKVNNIFGSIMPEIKTINITGEKVTLDNTTYKTSKFTLIELWASWCVPCRQVNTDLHAKREQYKKMGLTIVGFSLDENYKNWINAVEKDNTGWLQISDLKASNSPLSIFLKLKSIPANILIDSSGKVVAQNIYKDELDNFLLKHQDNKNL